MYSLPWVVILFIFFPRISFEHANYGFKGETTQRMGHDGTMYLNKKALLVPSDRIVMEVGFEKEVPSSEKLYFRGSVLYIDKQDHWEALPEYVKRETRIYNPVKGEKIDYKVTLYPTQKHWIYTLDMPIRSVQDAELDKDLISKLEKPVKEPLHYTASSVLSPLYHDLLDPFTHSEALYFNEDYNPKTYLAAQKIKESFNTAQERTKAIVNFFKSQSLTYTLQPEALDLNNSADSFLFDTRKGYCVHFASSFVTMARMADIPARIVTGYKADKLNSLNNYLPIKERDAHAWAELYINENWVRYESTSWAVGMDEMSAQILGTSTGKNDNHQLLEKVNLYLMYVKYQVETWILYYSNIRQLQLLQYAKENPRFILIFILALVALVIVSFSITLYFRRPRCTNETLCILEPLLKVLKDQGYTRKEDETMHQFFLRYMNDHSEINTLKEVDEYYELISYGGDVSIETKKKLKAVVKKSLLQQ